ncbi:MAG: hypothetical protein AAF491_07055, partial [Verrucomicrobiota bacterium]
METVTLNDLKRGLEQGAWKEVFSEAAIAEGEKFVGAKLVAHVSGELLENGDAELTGTVIEKSGEEFRPIVAVWIEEGRLVFEGDCRCSEKMNCRHAAALLIYLTKGKGVRLDQALGRIESADETTGGKTVVLDEAEEGEGEDVGPGKTTFLLRVEKRPEGERSAWMPEILAA